MIMIPFTHQVSLLEEERMVLVVAHLPSTERASDVDMEVIQVEGQNEAASQWFLELRVAPPAASRSSISAGSVSAEPQRTILRVQLPAAVDDTRVKAKFDRIKRQMTVKFALL